MILFLSCQKKTTQLSQDLNSLLKTSKNHIQIRKTYDLKGGLIKISNKSIDFQKGSIVNGTLVCKNCELKNPQKGSLHKINLQGNPKNKAIGLHWFVNQNNQDSEYNFNVLKNIVKLNKEVYIEGMFPISAANSRDLYSTNNDIRIQGKDKQSSGLILMTIHANTFFNYFQSNNGNNLSLNDIRLTTKSYEKGIENLGPIYRLSGSYYQKDYNPESKPNIDYVIVKNCIINGNISIASYGSNSNNQSVKEWASKNKVKKVEIINNVFDSCKTPFSFSNMGFDDVVVKENKVYNLSECFLSFPASGIDVEKYYPQLMENRGNVVFDSNEFENTKVLDIEKDRTMTPMIIKGGDGSLIFINNTVKNLISSSRDAQVNTFYYTCSPKGKAIVKGNIFYNCIGYGGRKRPASLVKQRGASNFKMINNSFIIDKEGFFKAGILRSIEQDLFSLDFTDFHCDFIQTGSNTGLKKSYEVIGNTFKVPYINKSTEIADAASILMENNIIEIDYFGTYGKNTSVSREGVFFLARNRYNREIDIPLGEMIMTNNEITINKSFTSHISWIQRPEGTQRGTLEKTDNEYNFSKVIMDDQFNLKNNTISYALSDAQEQIYQSKLNGKGAFFIERYYGVGHNRPDAEKLSVSFDVKDFQSMDKGVFILQSDAEQSLIAKHNSANKINVLDYVYLESIYPLRNISGIFAEVHLDFVGNLNKRQKIVWVIFIDNKNRMIYLLNNDLKVVKINPSQEGKRINLQKEQNLPYLEIISGNGVKKPAQIVINNTQNVKGFTLSLNTESINGQFFAKDLKKRIGH